MKVVIEEPNAAILFEWDGITVQNIDDTTIHTSEKDPDDAFSDCVLGHTSVVVYDTQEHKRVNDDFAEGDFIG